MSRRYVDLTFPIHTGMTTFPVYWHPFVEVTQLARLGIEQRETRKLVLGTHTGTHMDAPRHFIEGGQTVDEIPLELLAGPATILDFSCLPERHEISRDQIMDATGGQPAERLVLRYDWSDHWGSDKYYRDHPFLSDTAATWLVDNGIRLLAMDTPMPDNPENGKGSTNDSPIHKIVLGSGAILVEYLCNLRTLTGPSFEFIVLPLKVSGGDGAPVRAIGIEDV
jgi:kynurenine formamidase